MIKENKYQRYYEGLYSITEASKILNIKRSKLRYWVKKFWNDLYSDSSEKDDYIYKLDNENVINFYVLMELNLYNILVNDGVELSKLHKARMDLRKRYPNLKYPFASKSVLENMTYENKHLYIKNRNGLYYIELNMDGQIVDKDFATFYSKKIEYGDNDLISRFYLNEKKSIYIDPSINFGSEVLKDSLLTVDSIYDFYKAGESIDYLADYYEIDKSSIEDVINYKQSIAA